MAEAQLRAELTEFMAEIKNLKERISVRTTTFNKELSLISLSTEWSVSGKVIPLEDADG